MERRSTALSALIGIVAASAAAAGTPSTGQTSATAESESFLSRDTFTGDWGGLRKDLADRGITLDVSVTEYYSGAFSGGNDDSFDFGGRSDVFLNLDTAKLGLWDGGGFHVHAESRFGEAADRPIPRSGGLWPVSTGLVLPLGEPERVVASSLYLSQRLGDSAVVLLGKINVVDLLAADPFFGGWGRDRFTNIAFVAPPSGVVPPTIMGAVLNYTIRPFSFTLMAFDPNDRTNDYWPEDLFDKGVNISLGTTWTGSLAGRSSSVGITGTYSTKEGANLSDLSLSPGLQGGTKQGSYNISLAFSHLLYEAPGSPGKGLGVYGKAAVADGNPNPIRSSFVGGFAGHGIVPGRPRDVFGLGFYFYNFSDDLQDSLEPQLAVDDEQGVELFYNLAVTPWLHVSADLQWIDPARGAIKDAWVGGLRMNLTF